ncbi:MAG TPA: bifunctional hydroxymethylpyrimidine kinase/phosphomethylpyrimidine kinase [Ruminococcus sp.]|nr:bifunctional hydroxymethylpyrimidine kinase/phosphomethylpyrimidine kinase [Ruminococcus sp.]
MYKILSIAGSDCSGGAGIQADLKTIAAHGMYGMAVITSLTAQNTVCVSDIFDVPADFVKKQIYSVFTDIFPDAIKTGMVSNSEIIHAIAEYFETFKPQNIVVDTVMISTSGNRLISENACDTLINELLPLADIITPNIPEAEFLSEMKIVSDDSRLYAAEKIASMTKGAVLIKGGHSDKNSDDMLYMDGKPYFFKSAKIDNPNTHGTGCTLSSAIACNLAENHDIKKAVENAKSYITGAIEYGLDIGKGSGPLNHLYKL